MKREDYVGFSFNGKHSSEFNIVRTSGGSRFTENLLPTVQDKTIAVPGGDGAYLFGTHYTQRPRQISFAYDNLTERKLTEMIKWLEANQVGELILDEWPHKAWDAKVSASPTINFIPFDIEEWEEEGVPEEEREVRRYKGEGTVTFTAYQPYAHNPKGKKWIEDYDTAADPNLVSLLTVLGVAKNNDYDTFKPESATKKQCMINNTGNLVANFSLDLTMTANEKYTIGATELQTVEDYGKLNFTASADCTEMRVRVNNKLHLIEELDKDGKITGIVHNDWITSGDFFKLKTGESLISVIDNGTDSNPSIAYSHYYY